MAQFLKLIDLVSVEETGVDTTGSQYLKIVEVIEVIDQNGDDFFPQPMNN